MLAVSASGSRCSTTRFFPSLSLDGFSNSAGRSRSRRLQSVGFPVLPTILEEPQPAMDLSLHPSPVLTEAVLKVEQVVARLQDLQTTISGLHMSPVTSKLTRSSRENATNRVLNSKECLPDEYRLDFLKDYKAGSKIATLVAEALQEGPRKIQKPADQAKEPKDRIYKDGKRKYIAFTSKSQLHNTMSATAPLSKSVNKFKLALPSDVTAKLVPAAKPFRPKDPPMNGGLPSLSKRRISRGYWSNSSSPDSLSPRSPFLVPQSPEKKRRSFSSPESSFRDSGDADDELSCPRRLAMNVTEIRGLAKPWKLTPTKGVLFLDPVYSCASTKSSAPRPSPVKIVYTSKRRRDWLSHQKPESPEAGRRENLPKRRSNGSANPLTSSISKATSKREGTTKPDLAPGSIRREHRVRKSVVEIVPQKSTTTMFEVLKLRSSPRRLPESPARPDRTSRRLMPVDENSGLTGRPSVLGTNNEMAKDLRSRDLHAHAKSSPNVENLSGKHEEALTHPKGSGAVESSDKENAPAPSCAPAVMFLRSMSSAHPLNRTSSRKNSGGSLF